MKTFSFSILSVAAALTLAACSSEDIDRYDASYVAINIGFGNESTLTQTTAFNYSESSTERPVTFYARISGTPVDYDRAFTLEAVDGDITQAGTSYRFDSYVIPAGEVSGEYTIYFDPAGLSSPAAFADEEGELVFRVAANENFVLGAKDQNELRFTLRNSLTMPDEWYTVSTYSHYALSRYFGDYSPEKFRFMLENGCPVNFQVSYSQATPTTVEGNITILSSSYATYLQQSLQIALAEYNRTHDTPLCDSLGNPISF